MKKLLLLSLFMLVFSIVNASHIVGGEIRINHIQGFDYRLEMSLYRDIQGVPAPPTANIKVYGRENSNYIWTYPVPLDTSFTIPPKTIGCGSPILTIEQYEYVDTITLDPYYWIDSAGYLFVWSQCCRNAAIQNITVSAGSGSSIVTLFPPVMKNGVPFVNSSPKLSSPISDFAINSHPYSLNFGGTDEDGDQIEYSLYTPFEGNSNGAVPGAGWVTGYSFPYTDPTTQFAPIQWAPGYTSYNVITGLNGLTQNSLQINQNTGELTMIPDVPAPAYYIFGIWAREYRNGELIGSVFRDFQISVLDYQIDPNTAPQVHVPQLQSLATWDADTMIFTGSPVCIQIGVTDPDSIADIEIEAVYSDYDLGDLTFVQSSAIILNPDTFQTALCFQPDSFLPYTTRGEIVALNPGCYDLRGDTLPFYFKFVGYSNAGTGGNISIPITPTLGNLDLITYLNGNPNPGGTWLDLDNSGLLTGGMLDASGINSDITYRFTYIDQQPNYPADTAVLEMNFFIVQSLGVSNQLSEVSIYPNPSKGVMTLDVSNDLVGKAASVYTLDSKEIQSFILDSNTNTIYIEKSGMYLMKIEGKTQVHKVFIEN